MEELQIRFDDGAEYEQFMGVWSQLAGDTFLDWVAPAAGLRWVDVGCGNGAFTETLIQLCAAAEVQGIDPSEAQLAFARTRFADGVAQFQQGDAMALPFADAAFDAAAMALVLFFVPEPARGVAEMVRVVRPGGTVCAYVWDMHGGGFPIAALHQEMAALGTQPLWPPSVEASRIEALRSLWTGAGLVQVETRQIEVQRSFPDFDTFWKIALTGPGINVKLAAMALDDVAVLKERLQARLVPDAEGRIACAARANAVKGRVPG
ncbi:MAG: methyltransferase domain-containing protein [Betaproteobacteria bacterium]